MVEYYFVCDQILFLFLGKVSFQTRIGGRGKFAVGHRVFYNGFNIFPHMFLAFFNENL